MAPGMSPKRAQCPVPEPHVEHPWAVAVDNPAWEVPHRWCPGAKPQHEYLSTGCLHGHHHYCQHAAGLTGPKLPGQCKFCAAPCVCPCHTEEAR